MSMMYTLTAMTGKEASAHRTVVIGTIEFNWRVWMILVWTAPVALLAAVIVWPFLGQLSIVMIPIVEGIAVFMIHRRTSQGLRLRTYQALWDKKKDATNSFMLCAQKIQVTDTDYRVLMENTAPYIAPEPASSVAFVDQMGHAPVGDRAFEQRSIPPHFEPLPSAPQAPEHTLDSSLIGRETDTETVDASQWLDFEPSETDALEGSS